MKRTLITFVMCLILVTLGGCSTLPSMSIDTTTQEKTTINKTTVQTTTEFKTKVFEMNTIEFDECVYIEFNKTKGEDQFETYGVVDSDKRFSTFEFEDYRVYYLEYSEENINEVHRIAKEFQRGTIYETNPIESFGIDLFETKINCANLGCQEMDNGEIYNILGYNIIIEISKDEFKISYDYMLYQSVDGVVVKANEGKICNYQYDVIRFCEQSHKVDTYSFSDGWEIEIYTSEDKIIYSSEN